MAPLLEVKNLCVQFPFQEKPAVSNLSFQLNKGETLALVGESGSGKSITSLAIMGLLPNNAEKNGEILFQIAGEKSININAAGAMGLRGKSITMIFQEPMSALNPVMTVGQQLHECLQQNKNYKGRQWAKEKEREWFTKVKLPSPESIGKKYPHQLSGGQKQRVMIAMAMCNEPQLLIADEPTTALDAHIQHEILQLMKQLQAEMQTAMLFITHDLEVAKTMANDVLVLYRGDVMEYGTTQQVFHQPQSRYTEALLQTKPSGSKRGYRLPVVADFINEELLPQPVPVHHEVDWNKELLKVENLFVQFPVRRDWKGTIQEWFTAVNHVSFTVHEKETLALVGESGSGKSTIGKAIKGLVPIEKGKISWQGMATNDAKTLRKNVGIQMVFQDAMAALNPRMTAGDAIAEPMWVHDKMNRTERSKQVKKLLDLTGLAANSFQKYPHEFSGGQKQRLGIARSLALQPQLLICDESVSALDVSVSAQILNLLNDLKTELNLAYLFITHDLNVVEYLCDRVIVLHQGAIVEEGQGKSWFDHPQSDYTKTLFRYKRKGEL